MAVGISLLEVEMDYSFNNIRLDIIYVMGGAVIVIYFFTMYSNIFLLQYIF